MTDTTPSARRSLMEHERDAGTRAEALAELIAKVQAGQHGRWSFDALGEDASGLALDAFHGSLDAARALHEAALPRQGWEVFKTGEYPGMIPGSSPFRFAARVGYGTVHRGDADKPARAWLLAILRALQAQQEGAKG